MEPRTERSKFGFENLTNKVDQVMNEVSRSLGANLSGASELERRSFYSGTTPAHIATRSGNVEMLRLLGELGARSSRFSSVLRRVRLDFRNMERRPPKLDFLFVFGFAGSFGMHVRRL